MRAAYLTLPQLSPTGDSQLIPPSLAQESEEAPEAVYGFKNLHILR